MSTTVPRRLTHPQAHATPRLPVSTNAREIPEPSLERHAAVSPASAESVSDAYDRSWFGCPRPTINGARGGLFLGSGVGVFAGVGADLCLGASASAFPPHAGTGVSPMLGAGVATGVHMLAGAGVWVGPFTGAHISWTLGRCGGRPK